MEIIKTLYTCYFVTGEILLVKPFLFKEDGEIIV